MYGGLSATLISSIPTDAVYFCTYEICKRELVGVGVVWRVWLCGIAWLCACLMVCLRVFVCRFVLVWCGCYGMVWFVLLCV